MFPCPFAFNALSRFEQVRAKIIRGEYDMPDVLFQHLPAEAKDFISKLLVVNSEKRMSADQALTHPWLRRAARLSARRGLLLSALPLPQLYF